MYEKRIFKIVMFIMLCLFGLLISYFIIYGFPEQENRFPKSEGKIYWYDKNNNLIKINLIENAYRSPVDDKIEGGIIKYFNGTEEKITIN